MALHYLWNSRQPPFLTITEEKSPPDRLKTPLSEEVMGTLYRERVYDLWCIETSGTTGTSATTSTDFYG